MRSSQRGKSIFNNGVKLDFNKSILPQPALKDLPKEKSETSETKFEEVLSLFEKVIQNKIKELEGYSLINTDISAQKELSLKENQELASHVNSLLLNILNNQKARIDLLPENENKKASIVTGAPGSGKSIVSRREKFNQESDLSQSFYVCGDEIKKAFKELALSDPFLSQFPKLQDDVYIHKITSDVSWKLLDYCIDKDKNFVLEMLGTDHTNDANLIQDLSKKGYNVSLSHVFTTEEEMIFNIINRYIGNSNKESQSDKGRYIPILSALKTRVKSLNSFEQCVGLLKEKAPDCAIKMYNNDDRKMELLVNDVALLLSDKVSEISDIVRNDHSHDYNIPDSHKLKQ